MYSFSSKDHLKLEKCKNLVIDIIDIILYNEFNKIESSFWAKKEKNNMKKMVVAVIGCGRIANMAHFPALTNLEDVRIKYACDLFIENCRIELTHFADLLTCADLTCVEEIRCFSAALCDELAKLEHVCSHKEFNKLFLVTHSIPP
jgi:hypothetical protein